MAESEAVSWDGPLTFKDRYARLVSDATNGLVLYYRARVSRNGGVYFGVAVVGNVHRDPSRDGYCVAEVRGFRRLDRDVSLIEGGRIHERSFNGHNWRSIAIRQVREIPEKELDAILEDSVSVVSPGHSHPGMHEFPEAVGTSYYAPEPDEALRYESVKRIRRARLRSQALRIYGGSCCLSLVDQTLKPGIVEADCCHFWPLEDSGPDVIQNTLLIGRSLHAAFDCGLIALEDDFRLLVKDTLHPKYRGLLNKDGFARMPTERNSYPAVEFIRYHRQRIFGSIS